MSRLPSWSIAIASGAGSSSRPVCDVTRQAERSGALLDVLWLLVFGGLSAWWCLSAAQQLSATFDEPTYLRLGLEHWRTGSARELLELGVMPLAADLQTLPLFVRKQFEVFNQGGGYAASMVLAGLALLTLLLMNLINKKEERV